MFLGLVLGNSFGTCEGSLFVVLLTTMGGLIIGTWGVALVGLSLLFPIGYPLESPNLGAVLPVTLLVTPLGLWFGSE